MVIAEKREEGKLANCPIGLLSVQASIDFNVRLLGTFGLLLWLGSVKVYTGEILRSILFEGFANELEGSRRAH
ncbi:hypothetical protein C7B67_17100 [filamentous cyanobacterium Phorm 6]|nr:hypothetical protein C7B67_17100 [filamentous cyanobacterium Phorm 6]